MRAQAARADRDDRRRRARRRAAARDRRRWSRSPGRPTRRREWKIAFAREGGPAEVAVADATGEVTPPRPPRPETSARLMRRLHDGTGMGPVWQIDHLHRRHHPGDPRGHRHRHVAAQPRLARRSSGASGARAARAGARSRRSDGDGAEPSSPPRRDFRRWLAANHDKAPTSCSSASGRRRSGRPSIDWPQARDQALCFGWIDGVRKSLGDESYTIRFTPRRKGSIWSKVNVARYEALTADGQMTAAGVRAYEENKAPHRRLRL